MLSKAIQQIRNKPTYPSVLLLCTVLLIAVNTGCSRTSPVAQSPKTITPDPDEPILVVNQQPVPQGVDLRPRVKDKYIEGIHFLKGEPAIEKYGESAKYGVMEVTVTNRNQALSDIISSKELDRQRKRAEQRAELQRDVDQKPILVGGIDSLMARMNYPKEAYDARVQGKIIVKMIITRSGEVCNPQIVQGIGFGCDQEVLRIVKHTDFKPARLNGTAVKAPFTVEIDFRISALSDQ
ncbi:MAG: energy transducer TonB [Bacteroidota bacterium]